MFVIGFVGTKGVGKDTAADILVTKHGFVRRKFAQPIKDVCSILFQIPGTHFEGPEKETVVEKHDWCAYQPDNTRVVVTDIRFQNEVDAVKRLGGLVVRIVRSNGTGRHLAQDSHVTETGIAHLEGVDAHINNDEDVSSLWNKVQELVTNYVAAS